MWQKLTEAQGTILAAIIGGIFLCIVAIVGLGNPIVEKWSELQLSGSPAPASSSSSTDEPPTYNPTQIPNGQTSESDITNIPSYEEKGIAWCTDYSGIHTIEYISGAYSPWPTNDGCDPKGCWKSAIFVYVNSNTDTIFNNAQGNPQNPHLRIGWNDWSPSISETEAKSRSLESRSLNLQAGDCLTFIAVDERESYHWPADNRGTVILQIRRP